MSEYCVDAVRYERQELKAVRMGLAQASGVLTPHDTPVAEAVARIEAQDTVRALLRADGKVEPGPRLKIVSDGHGGKTLALDNPAGDCLELADLERF